MLAISAMGVADVLAGQRDASTGQLTRTTSPAVRVTGQAARATGQAASTAGQSTRAIEAKRLSENPLLTVHSSPSLGDNVNGPTVIRVPDWVERPLGKYYMYFANHMGEFIRLAYADSPSGPWKIHEPGALHVRDTQFNREGPDPEGAIADFYTHVASPEIFVDNEHRRIIMWVHGWFTNGERWPPQLADARAWARQRGFAQFTQAAVSSDGLRFQTQPAITRTSYLRVFKRPDGYFGVSRLGLVSRAADPLAAFEPGLNLFRGTPYAGRVRHVAIVPKGNRLDLYFTAIGDAPERVLFTTVDVSGDWTTWRATTAQDVIAPEAPYECPGLPNAPSAGGDISVPVKQIRDPFVFEDAGRSWLYYAFCGEQGIAAAELHVR